MEPPVKPPLWPSIGVNAGIEVNKTVSALIGGHTDWQRTEKQIFQKTEPKAGAAEPMAGCWPRVISQPSSKSQFFNLQPTG